jgi:hypothetical protein
MRTRLPLIFIALFVLLALAAAGCGDSNPASNTKQNAIPESGFTPSSDTGDPSSDSSKDSGSSNDSASASAQRTVDACMKAAESLPDSDTVAKAKKNCQDSYDNIKESSKKIDEATSEAVARCKEAAKKISNAEAKARVLEACGKFD